jgi:hypothetical protein
MERMAWTDDRLDRQFEAMREEFRAMRTEMNEGFRELRAEIALLRSEMHDGMTSIRREMFVGAIALTGTWAAALAALVLHG